jgi:drug/metabolite transporter (DMT)-like permease
VIKKPLSEKIKALAAIISVVLFWGFSFISIKVTVAVFQPMSLGMLRFGIAIIFLYILKQKLAPSEKLRLKDIPLLIAAGFVGVTLYFFFENNGIYLVSASEASIAIGSIPVLTMIADVVFEKIKAKKNRMPQAQSRPGIQQWLGCFISIGGVILVAGVSFVISGSIRGYIYMSGAALSWVFYSFLTRALFTRCSRIYIVFWQSVAGFIMFIPFSFHEFSRWGNADAEVIIHLFFLAIFCSALGYWLYVYALDKLGVSVCAIFINLIPVVTVIASFIMLGDRLSSLQWLGAGLVIAGVYLTMIRHR